MAPLDADVGHHVGEAARHAEAAAEVFDAFASVLATTAVRTPDLGGDATTKRFTQLVLDNIANR